MDHLTDFWIQPTKGFTNETKGVSVPDLLLKEQQIGFKLPFTYCQLMQLQNGGLLSKYVINDELELKRIDQIEKTATFLDYLCTTKYEEDLLQMYEQFDFCDPKRLIIFSNLEGHGVACFDYGWLRENMLLEPQVVFINDDGNDFLHYGETQRFNSFDEFIDSLKHSHESISECQQDTLLVVQSALSFEEFITEVQAGWPIPFDAVSVDHHFGFENYYLGVVPLTVCDATIDEYIKSSGAIHSEMVEWIESEGRKRFIKSVYTPNESVNGRYMFPDKCSANIVIQIANSWFPKKYAVTNLKKELLENIKLKITDITIYNNH